MPLSPCLHNFPILHIPLHNGMQEGTFIPCKRQAEKEKQENNTESETLPRTQFKWSREEKCSQKHHTSLSSVSQLGCNSRTTVSAGNRRGWISTNSPTLLDRVQVCIISFGKQSEIARRLLFQLKHV